MHRSLSYHMVCKHFHFPTISKLSNHILSFTFLSVNKPFFTIKRKRPAVSCANKHLRKLTLTRSRCAVNRRKRFAWNIKFRQTAFSIGLCLFAHAHKSYHLGDQYNHSKIHRFCFHPVEPNQKSHAGDNFLMPLHSLFLESYYGLLSATPTEVAIFSISDYPTSATKPFDSG